MEIKSHEVKVGLDAQKGLELDDIAAELKQLYNLGEAESMEMQFLDGPDLELFKAGLVARLRRVGGEVELTLKWRQQVVDGKVDVAIAAAPELALNSKAELEVGTNRQTLTVSEDHTLANLPSTLEASLKALDDEALASGTPLAKRIGDLKKVTELRLYGPAHGRRWTGGHADVDDEIRFETWRLPAEGGHLDVLECSFKKKKKLDKVPILQQILLAQLEKWTGPEDALRTELILRSFQKTAVRG